MKTTFGKAALLALSIMPATVLHLTGAMKEKALLNTGARSARSTKLAVPE